MSGTSSPDARLTLERFLRELPSLDVQQLMAISAAHGAIERDAIDRARARAGDVARAGGTLDELHDLHATIIQWSGSQNSYSRLWTKEGAFDNPLEHVLHDVREQARPALLDAATALFLADRLSLEAFDTLVDPVDSVMG